MKRLEIWIRCVMTSDWFDKVRYHSLGWKTSQEFTYDCAILALHHGIPGDLVECGVYAGAQSALMARAIMDFEDKNHVVDTKRVHLFDSFTGIPAPGQHDIDLAANKGGESACSLEDVQKNMKEWGIPDELMMYHSGLFSVTVPLVASLGHISKIAVLRLDGDLYESTRDCLPLLDLVSPGGYVIVDDYQLDGCRKAMHEKVMPAPIYFRVPA